MRKLIEMTDESAREELGEYYIVSKNRMENLLRCFEGGRDRVSELTAIIKKQQDEIAELSKSIITFTEPAPIMHDLEPKVADCVQKHFNELIGTEPAREDK